MSYRYPTIFPQQSFILSSYLSPSSTIETDGGMSLIYNNFLVDFLLSAHIHHLLVSGRCWSPLKYVRVGNMLIYVSVQAASDYGIFSPIVSANWPYFNRPGT